MLVVPVAIAAMIVLMLVAGTVMTFPVTSMPMIRMPVMALFLIGVAMRVRVLVEH
jgi:hypothetical protein